MWVLFGSMSLYLLRINFSVAIVCMTYDPVDNATDSFHARQEVLNVEDPMTSFFRQFVGVGTGYNEEEPCPGDDDDDVE